MSMMNSIAAMGMSMAATQFQQNYSIAITKNVMQNQEQIAQGLLEMMPSDPTLGANIDTYA